MQLTNTEAYKICFNKNLNLIDKSKDFYSLTNDWVNVEKTIKQIADYINEGHPIVLCEMEEINGQIKRNNEAFVSSQMFALDFDNTEIVTDNNGKKQKVKSANYLSMLEALENPIIQNEGLLIYRTPSSTEEHNRFRVVFALPKKITNPLEYTRIVKAFAEHFNTDKTVDCCRLFYGSQNSYPIIIGKTLPEKTINKILKENAVKELKENPSFSIENIEFTQSESIAEPNNKLANPKYLELKEICRTTEKGARSEKDYALCCHAIKIGISKIDLWNDCKNIGKFQEGMQYFSNTYQKSLEAVISEPNKQMNFLYSLEKGDCEKATELIKDKYKYCSTKKAWYEYTKGIWKELEYIPILEIQNLFTKHLGRLFVESTNLLDVMKEPNEETRNKLQKGISELKKRINKYLTNTNINSLVRQMQNMREIVISIDSFDKDNNLINLKNGYINLTEMKFYEHSPDMLFTKQANCNCSQEAIDNLNTHINNKAKKWLLFLRKIFISKDGQTDYELISFIQEFMGTCLTGNIIQKLLYAYGEGANGKTVFFQTISNMLEKYASSLPIESLLQSYNNSSNYYIADLQGIRLSMSSEIPNNRTLNEATVKDLTGGEKIKAMIKYGNPFEFLPTHKLVIFGNSDLKISDTSNGIWRRILRVPFLYCLNQNEQRPFNLVMKEFESEFDGLFLWCLQGLIRFQSDGLNIPESIQQSTNEYKDSQDTFKSFIEEECEIFNEKTFLLSDFQDVKMKDLQTAYLTYCRTNNLRSQVNNAIEFTKLVEKHRFTIYRDRKDYRFVKGLRLLKL